MTFSRKGRIAAARLLVKREKEGKATISISQRVRDIANSSDVARNGKK